MRGLRELHNIAIHSLIRFVLSDSGRGYLLAYDHSGQPIQAAAGLDSPAAGEPAERDSLPPDGPGATARSLGQAGQPDSEPPQEHPELPGEQGRGDMP